jgi:hypothetical protein
MLSHLLFQTDKDQEWQVIQGLICEAFGLNRDSRLVLSVVDHEGDEILMYVQTMVLVLMIETCFPEAPFAAGQFSASLS